MSELLAMAGGEAEGLGSHRDRLLAAMAQAIAEQHGFHETTVADVVARARTSRRTFYEHFEDREDCFLALFTVVTDTLLGAVAEAATGDASWEERIDRGLRAYLEALAAEPALTRSCIQEIPAVGPRGTARVRAVNERAARQIVRLLDEARVHDPQLRPLSVEAATVITGGFRDLVILALDQGRDLTELHGVAADLLRRLTLHG